MKKVPAITEDERRLKKNAYMKAWYARNIQKRREKDAAYRQANRERINEKRRICAMSPDKVSEFRKKENARRARWEKETDRGRACVMARRERARMKRMEKQKTPRLRLSPEERRERKRLRMREYEKTRIRHPKSPEQKEKYIARQREARASDPERFRQYHKKFRDTHPKYYRGYNQKFLDANPGYMKDRARRRIENLADGYVASLLVDGTTLKTSDIPKDLIEIKRIQVRMRRLIYPQTAKTKTT